MTPKLVKRLLVIRKLYNFFKVMSIILFFARVLTNILFCDKIIFVIEGRSSLSPSVRECAVGASASEEYAKVALLDSGRTAVCLLEPDGEHRYMRKRGRDCISVKLGGTAESFAPSFLGERLFLLLFEQYID